MINNKLKYILALFIILSLSMNAFSATNFADDSNNIALQSSSADEVVADVANEVANDQTDDSQNNEETNTNTDDSKPGRSSAGSGSGFDFSSLGGNGSGNGSGFDIGSLIGGNGSGNGSGFDFSSLGGNGSGNSSFDISEILDLITKLMGGNETNTTNETVNPEVSDVPEVVTSTSYAPVSQSPVEKQSSHSIQRIRDGKTISEGDALKLDGLNKLFDSDFTNGHLLVYIDGKLVFNEITAGDLSTPIFWINGDYLGQHQITVEFTANGTSNTNKYTEDVYIA